jgi:hypothetical protein
MPVNHPRSHVKRCWRLSTVKTIPREGPRMATEVGTRRDPGASPRPQPKTPSLTRTSRASTLRVNGLQYGTGGNPRCSERFFRFFQVCFLWRGGSSTRRCAFFWASMSSPHGHPLLRPPKASPMEGVFDGRCWWNLNGVT